MGEEDAPPPAVETEEAPNAVEAPPAVDDHPVETPPVETPEETPVAERDDDAPAQTEEGTDSRGEPAAGAEPSTTQRSHHDAGAGDEDLVDCTFVVLPERFEHSAKVAATTPFGSVKAHLANSLPIPVEAMTLRQPDGRRAAAGRRVPRGLRRRRCRRGGAGARRGVPHRGGASGGGCGSRPKGRR